MQLLYSKPELDDLLQESRIAFAIQFRYMTQDELSDKLGLTGECKRRTMTRYEKGNRNQKENRTKEIATILNVSVNAIKKYDFRNLIDLFYTLLWLEELFPNYDLDLYYYKDRSIICAYYSDYYLLNDTSYDNKNKKISKVFKYYEEDSMDCINYCVDNFFRITCEKLLTFIYLMIILISMIWG